MKSSGGAQAVFGVAVAVVLVVAAVVANGCGKSAHPAASPPTSVVVVAPPLAPSPAPLEEADARWENSDGGRRWTRRRGEHAPPLVVRGTVTPVAVDEYGVGCEGMVGSRHGTPPIAIDVEGAPRRLHVFVRARGPIGVMAGEAPCATAKPNEWAHVELEGATGEVAIKLADVDLPGERRGQTSPYVVVVSDDDEPPAIDADPRTPVDPSAVRVRWVMTPSPCGDQYEYWSCWRATIELDGAVKMRVPLKRLVTGQVGCWPSGTGVHCGGASGASDLTLRSAADGTVEVSEYAQSDGYCPPPEECGSTTTWTKFKLRPGLRLVPDPVGTFPPLTPTE